ncbi:hypothetical protein L227DRAFT_512414 [Lentinus tigrinus ALCF2SS1-6]|uniref:Uncharacterized protein n=1 Tax=Lentinus tigrinus ALCF2SS1-6 TaxID=1328759 RepID=A0A5C2RU23_9APHY|nr:hypothetical protein L227DRAFT_512414 [Lentinus tigrinus ALCF2SS1-6]
MARTALHPGILTLCILCAWLHLVGHLPYQHCNVVLAVFRSILYDIGQFWLTSTIPATLASVLSTAHVNVDFHHLPVCPGCMRVFPESIYADMSAACPDCKHPLFNFDRDPKHGSPWLQFPCRTITEHLIDLFAIPGREDLVNYWKSRRRRRGFFSDIFDGMICHILQGYDGLSFFNYNGEDPDDELRLGVAMCIDWFSYLRSKVASSYTSCPISLNIVNFPAHLRFRAANLLLLGIIPGPKETGPDETQYFLRVFTNELYRLWRYGVVIPTPKYPQGRLVRVILVGVFCDKLAAHKIGGFGPHSHTFFCTLDWISRGMKATAKAFMRNAFPARTDAQHRSFMGEYQALKTPAQREKFAKAYATRWSELSRLPYFDMCRMIVVDPMHNLFLGLAKTHFYHIWVQLGILRPNKELKCFHDLLKDLRLPRKLGRLPHLIGEPAGGSLTSEQWLILTTIIGPMLFPHIWADCIPDPDGSRLASRLEHIASVFKKRKEVQEQKQSQRNPSASGNNRPRQSDDEGAVEIPESDAWPEKGPPRTFDLRNPRDLENLEKLAAALNIFLSETLTTAQVKEADQLLREYCTELLELYGPDVIRPNHHYATHTGDFVLDYGPLREFWTFIFERLNKILKNFHNNNHEGGEIECTFFGEFHRTAALFHLLEQGLREPPSASVHDACVRMVKATMDVRGTLQQLAREVDEATNDDGTAFELSPRASKGAMPIDLYWAFLLFLRACDPFHEYRATIALPIYPTGILVPNHAVFYDYVIVRGHRYAAACHAPSNHPENSLALIRTAGAALYWVGEIRYIVSYEAPNIPRRICAYVRWFKPAASSLAGTPWSPL